MTTIILLLVVCLFLAFIHLRSIEKTVQAKIRYTQQIKKVSNLREQLFQQYPYPFKKSKEDLESNLRKLEEEKGTLSQLSGVLSGEKRTRMITFRLASSLYLLTLFLITQPSFSANHAPIFLFIYTCLLLGWYTLARFAQKGERSAVIDAQLEIIHG